MTTSQLIEVEAESLDEARKQVESQLPQGFFVCSEKVISDGKPRTEKGIAETIEDAYARAQSVVPSGATVVETKELARPERKVYTVEAYDEQSAGVRAKNKSGGTAIIKAIRLVTSGSKGFLGIGKKPNQYEVEMLHQAVVEITYKTKSKISVQIADKETELRRLAEPIEAELKRIKAKSSELWRERELQDKTVNPNNMGDIVLRRMTMNEELKTLDDRQKKLEEALDRIRKQFAG